MSVNGTFNSQLDVFLASFNQPEEEAAKTVETEPVVAEATPVESPIEPEAATSVEPEIETPAQEEKTEEPAAEEKVKPKRHRRTKAEIEADRLKAEAEKAEATETKQEVKEKSVEKTEKTPVVEKSKTVPDTITVTINNNHTYKDIINALDLLPSVDDDFTKTKQEIQDKMNQIVVQSGMDRPNIEIMGQKIDELNALISARMAAMKTAYENLSSREDGILMRVIAKGSASGSPYNQGNDAARRANGIHAAENFISPKTKGKIDLFWGVYATRYAKNFYEAAAEQLENKRRLLKQQADFITMRS